MQFYLNTFGCKVNQYESQVILESWIEQGHAQVADPAQAEVVLVHSCAVTSKAVADLRKAVAALHRAAPRAGIIVTGCAAQTFGAELRGLPGVVKVFGKDQRLQLLQGPESLLDPAMQPVSTRAMLAGITNFQRARAQIKIQDGCSHGCTYCIVPLARGPGQSREPEAVVAEIERLLAAGFREMSLIGINLRLYGKDLRGAMDFWDLVRMLEQTFAPRWAGRARLRLSSLDPAMLGTKALDVIAGSRLLCPHLHLSLQSASESVLAAMGRGHYSPGPIQDFCRELSRELGLYALGADLLTGFPGEQEAHFQETLNFCSRLPLTYAHVFPFSPRPGTVAATRTDQVPEHLRQERAKILRSLAEEKRLRFWNNLAEKRELTMVVENADPAQGKSEYYVPCRLEDGSGRWIPRELVRVQPMGIGEKALRCRVADDSTQRVES